MKKMKFLLGIIAIGLVAGVGIFHACKKETNYTSETKGINDKLVHKEGEIVGWQVLERYYDAECNCTGYRVIFICAACQGPGYTPPDGAKPIYDEIKTPAGDGTGNGTSNGTDWHYIIGNLPMQILMDDLTKTSTTNRRAFVTLHREEFIQIIDAELVENVILGKYYIPIVVKEDHGNGKFRYNVYFRDIEDENFMVSAFVLFDYEQ